MEKIIHFIKRTRYDEFTVIFWQGVWLSPNISHLTACSVVSWSPLAPPVFNPRPNPAVNQRINWSLGGRGLKYSEPFVSQRCRPRVPFPSHPSRPIVYLLTAGWSYQPRFKRIVEHSSSARGSFHLLSANVAEISHLRLDFNLWLQIGKLLY